MNLHKKLITAALLACCALPAPAHELQANRVSLVLRDRNHLTLTLYLNYTDALHRILAPKRPMQEFLLTYSAMPTPALQKELQRAQAKLEAGIKLSLPNQKDLPIKNWLWPDPAKVQAALQERVMQAMVAPGDHSHEAPAEIRAEAVASQDITSLNLRLPDEIQPAMLVWYRPNQWWAEPNSAIPALKF